MYIYVYIYICMCIYRFSVDINKTGPCGSAVFVRFLEAVHSFYMWVCVFGYRKPKKTVQHMTTTEHQHPGSAKNAKTNNTNIPILWDSWKHNVKRNPEGPSTQYLRTPVLGPSGEGKGKTTSQSNLRSLSRCAQQPKSSEILVELFFVFAVVRRTSKVPDVFFFFGGGGWCCCLLLVAFRILFPSVPEYWCFLFSSCSL